MKNRRERIYDYRLSEYELVGVYESKDGYEKRLTFCCTENGEKFEITLKTRLDDFDFKPEEDRTESDLEKYTVGRGGIYGIENYLYVYKVEEFAEEMQPVEEPRTIKIIETSKVDGTSIVTGEGDHLASEYETVIARLYMGTTPEERAFPYYLEVRPYFFRTKNKEEAQIDTPDGYELENIDLDNMSTEELHKLKQDLQQIIDEIKANLKTISQQRASIAKLEEERKENQTKLDTEIEL